MKNLKIRLKLILSFGIITFLTIFVASVGIIGTINMSAADDNLYKNQTKPMTGIFGALNYVQRIRIQTRDLVLNAGNDEKIKSLETSININLTDLENVMASYDGTIIEEPEARKAFDDAKNQYATIFKPGVIEVLASAKAGANQETLVTMMGNLTSSTETMVGDFNKCIESRVASVEITVNNNDALSHTILTIIIIVLVISFTIATILALYISDLISKPLKAMSNFFMRFGTMGDLTLSKDEMSIVENRSEDEIGECINATVIFTKRLLDIKDKFTKIAESDLTVNIEILSEKDSIGLAIANMIENLNTMFSEIQIGSSQVSAGSEQISQVAQGLASGSTQQAASIEEFSASLTELQSKIEFNADNSAKAWEESNRAEFMLEESIHSMEKMLEAMKGIDESSKNITKIIKVIDDIAFQTNILALNAAVEAARAGQHGKGFAVVADEVRKLARKSAEAAKETATLIEGSTEKVIEGNQIVMKTNSSLKAVTVGARESGRILNEVATSSAEQNKSIKEMSLGIEQISTVVQSNSATAQQSAAAAQEMSAQSVMLNDILAKFNLKQSDTKINRTTDSQTSNKKLSSNAITLFGKY